MKKVLMPILALLVLFAVTPAVAAPATKTLFTAEASFIPGSISPGKGWVTKGGIQHIKGATSEGTVTGDISGTMLLVSDETMNLNTGKGTNHGRFVLTVDGGTFEGSFQSIVTLHVFSGTFIGHGTGTYEGQKIMGSHQGELTVDAIPVVEMVLDGIILLPKG